MSITFWMPQAPVERVVPYRDDDPHYYEIVPIPPFIEINLSQSNALAFLDRLCPHIKYKRDDPYGEWSREDATRVHRNAMRMLNSVAAESLVMPDFKSIGLLGCTVIDCGRSEDYVFRRLQQFVKLTKESIEHDFTIVFG